MDEPSMVTSCRLGGIRHQRGRVGSEHGRAAVVLIVVEVWRHTASEQGQRMLKVEENYDG